MPLVTGARLGRYEIRAPLGAGGMGEVYAAHDPQIGRDVALKVLPAAFSADPERLARFDQEARAAGALNHPNILSVYDVGMHDGVSYVVAELLEGESLRQVLAAGALPQRKAIDYATQIARGLAAAHERGIVHRDLKPDNIFITADGRAKVLDFGLAKLTAPSGAPDPADVTRAAETDPGVVLGTVGYMAPEQVRGQRVDHRADVFSFGCILYEMISGRKAFHRPTAVETLNAILTQEPPDLSESDRPFAPALERVMLRCLEKNPAARFQSASDLAFALESSAGSGADTARAAVTFRPATGTGWRMRLPWLVALLACVTTALAGARLFVRGGPAEAAMVRFAIAPPTRGTFQWIVGPSSAVSPDGRQLALVVTTEGRTQLYVRALDSLVLRPIAGSDGAWAPFWSPDSRSLAFVADDKVTRVDLAGGSPQTICRRRNVLSGAWGPDGTVLLAGFGSPILRVPASGGDPVPVSTIGQKETALWPAFLPDGRHFLYAAWPAGGKTELRAGSLDAADVKTLMTIESRAVYAPPGYLLFVREGVLLAQAFDARSFSIAGEPVAVANRVVYFQPTLFADFSASTDGVLAYLSGISRTRLVWVGRDGSELGTVGAPADYDLPRLSPDGQRLAVSTVDPRTGTSDIWLVDRARGTSTRFTADPGVEWAPTWSPDARQIAFAAHGGGIPNLQVKSVTAGDNQESLVPPGRDVQLPWDWVKTPAGQFILYMDRGETTGVDIMLLPMQGERKPVPWLQTKFDEWDARVSPDRTWVAYDSTASGRREVYVRALQAPSETWQISTAGGFTPTWRADGKELYYVSPDGDMMAVPISATTGFQAGKPERLFRVELARTSYSGYDVLPDGQRFLVNAADTTDPLSVTVAVNWTADLQKR